MFRISCSSSLHNGFDEPEILRWSNPKICPGSADVRHICILTNQSIDGFVCGDLEQVTNRPSGASLKGV